MDADWIVRAGPGLTGQTGHEQDHDGDNVGRKNHSAKITVTASKDSFIIFNI